MLVFVSGPLGAEDQWEHNVAEACRLGDMLSALGFAVFVPHAYVEWHRHSPADYETWMARDLAVLRHCRGLVRLPGESPGADREVEALRARYDKDKERLWHPGLAKAPIILARGWTAVDLGRELLANEYKP